MILRSLDDFEIGLERNIDSQSIDAFNNAATNVAYEMGASGNMPKITPLTLPPDASLLVVSKVPPARPSGSSAADLRYIKEVLDMEQLNHSVDVSLVAHPTPVIIRKDQDPILSSVRSCSAQVEEFELYFSLCSKRGMRPFSRGLQRQLKSGQRKFHSMVIPPIAIPAANLAPSGHTLVERARILSSFGALVAERVGEISLDALRLIQL